MDIKKIDQIFAETAYVRTGSSNEGLKCAEYLKEKCTEMGLDAYFEEFEVEMADITKASSLSECKGKIVMIDGYLRHWTYQDIFKRGAVGVISYDGNAKCCPVAKEMPENMQEKLDIYCYANVTLKNKIHRGMK